MLLLITALGAALRFFRLDQPCLWGDEALTFSRTWGTYAGLLDKLVDDGFGPLHYEAYWALARVRILTPFMMRLIPAVAGTLMVPAMYFLTSRFFPRKTALLAALLTATSAFLLNYSRDAKMYSHLWLFVALNVGCFFWWMKTGKLTPWLGWIAAGCAMVGTQFVSLPALALQPLFLLTFPKLVWHRILFFLIGVLIIFSGPIGYLKYFNQWGERIDERGWRASGVSWVPWYNTNRTAEEMVLYTSTGYLLGWEWPRTSSESQINPKVYTAMRTAGTITFVMLAAAVFPWPRRWRSSAARVGPLARTDVGLKIDARPIPWALSVFWLSAWIVLPAYGFYCRSGGAVADRGLFASPMDWIDAVLPDVLHGPIEHPWIAALPLLVPIVLALLMLLFAPDTRRPLARLLTTLIIAAILWGVCLIIFTVMRELARKDYDAGKAWVSVWMPRYLGSIWPAVFMMVAALFMRLPTRPIRWLAIFLFIGFNLTQFGGRVLAGTEPPVEQAARDVFDAQFPNTTTRTYINARFGGPTPGSGWLQSEPGKYYLQVLALQNGKVPPGRVLSDVPFDTTEYRQTNVNLLWRFRQMNFSAIPNEMNDPVKSKNITRLIIWRMFDVHAMPPSKDSDPIAGWRLIKQDWYATRNHWEWQELSRFERREYERDPTYVKPATPAPNKRGDSRQNRSPSR